MVKPEFLDRESSSDHRAQRGFVLVWMTIMLSTLLGISALAVEWNNWNRVGSDMQKAADAAALAGVVYLPNDFATAQAKAAEIAAANGFEDGPDTSVVIERDVATPSILIVTISSNVDNLLGNTFGFVSRDLVRVGKAQFSSPLPMGSPGVNFGSDPDELMATGEMGLIGKADGPYPGFWAQIGGGGAKWQGEVKMSPRCGAVIGITSDICSSEGVNLEQDPNGWIFEIEARQPGNINFEIFDPAWVNDLLCGVSSSTLFPAYTAAAALDPAAIPGYPQGPGHVAPPSQRYEPVARPGENRFCTRDNRVFWEAPWAQRSPPLWTTYRLYGPGEHFAEAPLIDECQYGFPGIARTNHGGAPLPINTLLTDPVAINGYIDTAYHPIPDDLPPFGSYYRAWWELCDVDAAEAGKYFLQVTTAEHVDGTPVAGFEDVRAGNHFSVRAWNEDQGPLGPATDTTTSAAGWGMMQAWMDAYAETTSGNQTEFYLLRLEPANYDRRLVVSAYDLGDFTPVPCIEPIPEDCDSPVDIPADMWIDPPPESNYDVFEDCTYTDPRGREFVSQRPLTETPTLIPGCHIQDVGTPFAMPGLDNWRGKWVDIVVVVPADYTCDTETRGGCWLRLRYQFSPSQRLHDGVALTATVDGDPVRLVG